MIVHHWVNVTPKMGTWVCLKMGKTHKRPFKLGKMMIILWSWGVSYFQTNPYESGRLLQKISTYKVDGYLLTPFIHVQRRHPEGSMDEKTLCSKSLDPTSLSHWKNLDTHTLQYSGENMENPSYCGQIMYDAFQCPICHCRLWLHQKHPKITASPPSGSEGATALEFQISRQFKGPRIWPCLQYKHGQQVYPAKKKKRCLVFHFKSTSD